VNGPQAWEEKPWRLCRIQAAVSSHTLPDVKLMSRETYPADKRESDAIAAVGGATPKDRKQSERKPPLKDQVDADQDEAAGYEGVDGDTYIVGGNGNRVLDAGQLDPYNGEQVGGDQEVLAEHHQRIREAGEGTEDGGDQGELAGGDQGAQGQIATGPGSILSPGNSPPPRVTPALTGPEAIQLRLRQKKEEIGRLRVLRDQIEQGELDVLYQAGRDQEEAHQQAKKLAAQSERTRQKAKHKRIKTREAEEKKKKKVPKQGPDDGGEASGWVPMPMTDDRGCVVYNQSCRVKYHPKNVP
jgi:hypothetical protein